MDQNNEKENIKIDDVEKDIQKSIEEMKNRDEYPWPEKKYKEIENQKVSPMTSIKDEHDRRKKRDKIVISFLIIISMLLVIISSILLLKPGNPGEKDIDKPKQTAVVSKGSQVIHDIKFSVDEIDKKADTVAANLSVTNNSKNNFYVTVSGISLVDENGKEYYPNLYKGELSANFYGKKILPNTKQSAKVVFENIPDTTKELTLIVNNVSDVYHFTWDYMITLP